jgi:hypothetical protein
MKDSGWISRGTLENIGLIVAVLLVLWWLTSGKTINCAAGDEICLDAKYGGG